MEATLRLLPLLEPLRPEIEQVQCLLGSLAAEADEPLQSMLRHVLGGGKWLRSALVILVGQVFAADAAPLCRLAAAVEVLHTATLVHDDIVDEAALRRGRETLHTLWPTEVAVLVGDYLLARSAALIASLDSPCLLGIFAQMLCAVSAGEIEEALDRDQDHLQREDYYRHVGAKSAALFAAAAEMSGLLGGAEKAHIEALHRFGHELGLAFQIVDDVLDLVGSEAELGKPAGSDLRGGVATLPTICYLEQARDDTVVRRVLAGQRDPEHVRAAVQAVCSSGAIEMALAEAHAHARRGQEVLQLLPDNAARLALSALARRAVERSY